MEHYLLIQPAALYLHYFDYILSIVNCDYISSSFFFFLHELAFIIRASVADCISAEVRLLPESSSLPAFGISYILVFMSNSSPSFSQCDEHTGNLCMAISSPW
jgi:hypothetical protein